MAFTNPRELTDLQRKKVEPLTQEKIDAFKATIQEKIDAKGYTVMSLPGGTKLPDFTYTLGRTTQALPELLVVSTLPSNVIGGLFTLIIEHQAQHGVQLDTPIELVTPTTTIACYMTDVTTDYTKSFITSFDHFYPQGKIVQVFLTDMQGRYSWDTGNECANFGQFDLRQEPFQIKPND